MTFHLHAPRRAPISTPMHDRFFVMLLWLWFFLGPLRGAGAATPVTLSETDVVRLALKRSPASVVAKATDELAFAHSETANPLPNPTLEWARETVDSGPASARGSQDLFFATMPLDLAKPLSSRAVAASEAAWWGADAALSRSDGVLEAVLAYYSLVLVGRHVVVMERSVAALEEATRVLHKREAAGSASGYESARLTVARELGRSRLAEARGDMKAARVHLAALLALDPESLSVTTELELVDAPASDLWINSRGERRASLAKAAQSLDSAENAASRSKWTWLPSLEISGGLKRANTFGLDNGFGYVLGAALDVPLFDRGQQERSLADAQVTLARARKEALERRITAEISTAGSAYVVARDELIRFESQTSNPIETLLAAAVSGYRDGERSIVELLDAQRARTEVEERRLELLGNAKRAEARLRAAVGVLQ